MLRSNEAAITAPKDTHTAPPAAPLAHRRRGLRPLLRVHPLLLLLLLERSGQTGPGV